jgi:predicted RNase H-like nuclease (RuvC/YqgF family)
MENLVKEARTCHGEHTTHGKFIQRLADRIEELEAQSREDAMQYLSDTGQMGDTIDDLTRRHQHALHKIDVLEARLAELKGEKDE